MRRGVRLGTILLAVLGACRGPDRSPADVALQAQVDSLLPTVEQATGLTFKRHPRAHMISREAAARYVAAGVQKEFPGDRAADLAESFKLFGLIPDSIDLRRLLAGVLAEQVAGFYDPDSAAFFGVQSANTSPDVFRLTVEHELVHALQDDHMSLDSLLDDTTDSDRLLAAKAVLEGQATLAMFRAQPNVGDQVLQQAFWDNARELIRQQQGSMPAFNAAPWIVREGLLFPYISGAEYMRWWMTHHPTGEMPYGARLPRSSEEILAPERVAAGDRPLRVTFVGAPKPELSDLLGAAGMRVLLAESRHQADLVAPEALGWGGDRFELFDAGAGAALVWIAAFDGVPAREAMFTALTHRLDATRPGYRAAVERLDVSGHPGLRLVIAPTGWSSWTSLPTATATPEQ